MKKILCVSAIMIIVMILAPLTALSTKTTAKEVLVFENFEQTPDNTEYFSVYNSSTKKIEQLTARDYIFGVVAAEMPASYGEEALKAQAVAAYTFAIFRKNENSAKEYDITTDYTIDQSYISKEGANEKWGSKAEEYIRKIENAVDSVLGYVITYDSLPILSVYCASSSGKTQNAKDVWGGQYPYLVSVNSEWDKLDSNNTSTAVFSSKELKEKLGKLADIGGEKETWIRDITKNKAGYVEELIICSKEVSGIKIREALELKSTAFSVSLKDDKFTFTVNGYGHGVGMSQVGAGYMAEQSHTFKEILMHYYTDCKIEKIN